MRAPTHPGKIVTPAEIQQLREEQIAKGKVRQKEIEEHCRAYSAKIATGVYGESNTRPPVPEVKSIPVAEVHVETREDRVRRAAERVRILLGR